MNPPGPFRRPERPRATSELGSPRTLLADPEQFQELAPAAAGSTDTLLLGLGPDPAQAQGIPAPGSRVSYVECPAFREQFPGWDRAVPDGWQPLSPQDVTDDQLRTARLLLYRHNPSLFPSFWGPLLARARWLRSAPAAAPPARDLALLPVRQDGLLARESAWGLEQCGLRVRHCAPDPAVVGAVAT
jgi:hypothetical protein